MELYYDNIQRVISNDETINFFAYAMTPLHAVGVNAVMAYLNSKGIYLNGYIIICSHSKTGKHVSETDFFVNGNNIRIVDGEPDFKKKRSNIDKFKGKLCSVDSINHDKSKVYVTYSHIDLELYNIIKQSGREYTFFILDDGGASYVSRMHNAVSFATIYSPYNSLIKTYMHICKAVLRTLLSEYFEKKLARSKRIIDFRIFTSNLFEKNSISSPYYIEAFKKLGTEKDSFAYNQPYILINTQCFKECNMTDGIIDYNLYDKIVSIIKKYFNCIVVKPHPRELDAGEKYKDFGCEVFTRNNVTQEVLLANSTKLPVVIISISSSTLLNATGLFGIPAISLAKMLLQEDLIKETRNETLNYVKQYKDVIAFPNSFDDFEEIIRGYVHTKNTK